MLFRILYTIVAFKLQKVSVNISYCIIHKYTITHTHIIYFVQYIIACLNIIEHIIDHIFPCVFILHSHQCFLLFITLQNKQQQTIDFKASVLLTGL